MKPIHSFTPQEQDDLAIALILLHDYKMQLAGQGFTGDVALPIIKLALKLDVEERRQKFLAKIPPMRMEIK